MMFFTYRCRDFTGARNGCTATITAQATYGSKTLTATKEIAVIRLLVTDGAGTAVPPRPR